MFEEDLSKEELKKVLEEYRNKMLEETKKKEEMKKKIDDYFLGFENDANNLKSKESNPLKLDMYEKYICSSFGHDPERTYNGAIKVENGLCRCKLCGKTYTLEKNTEKTK